MWDMVLAPVPATNRSIIEYSAIVWDPYYAKDIEKVEKIQPQTTRFIRGDYTSSVVAFFITS